MKELEVIELKKYRIKYGLSKTSVRLRQDGNSMNQSGSIVSHLKVPYIASDLISALVKQTADFDFREIQTGITASK
jgi:hypothetical protein